MARFKLKELWREWERKKGEKLSYRKLERETKISNQTLQRIANDPNTNTTISTLEKLAKFFGVQVEDIIDNDK